MSYVARAFARDRLRQPTRGRGGELLHPARRLALFSVASPCSARRRQSSKMSNPRRNTRGYLSVLPLPIETPGIASSGWGGYPLEDLVAMQLGRAPLRGERGRVTFCSAPSPSPFAILDTSASNFGSCPVPRSARCSPSPGPLSCIVRRVGRHEHISARSSCARATRT